MLARHFGRRLGARVLNEACVLSLSLSLSLSLEEDICLEERETGSDAEASLCAPLVEPVFVGAAPRAWAAKYSRDARASGVGVVRESCFLFGRIRLVLWWPSVRLLSRKCDFREVCDIRRALVPAPRPQIAHSVDRDRLAACAADGPRHFGEPPFESQSWGF